ncbi:MAG: hypothetical protein ACODAE_06570 [Gemmatimonadota bacterium]
MERAVLVVVAAAVAASACGPSVRSATFTERSPRPRDHPVRVYSTQLPECDYEELGLVRVSEGMAFAVSLDAMLDALRERAREMGGDAVVGVTQISTTEGGTVTGQAVNLNTDDGLAGTVIRFSDADCTR